MKKKILLTGVTGCLGSHLARALLAGGHEVVALKRRSSLLGRIESHASDMVIFDTEGLDFNDIFRRCPNIDVIIHTATCYGRDNESVSEIFKANTEFPLRLLDAGTRAGVEVFLNTDTILDQYLNLYALSKNQLLQWGKFFSLHEKTRFLNVRLEHFYGPNDDFSKFSTHVISSCLRHVPELRLTLGEQERDFIYVEDVVSAYMVLLNRMADFRDGFIEFEVGSGRSISIREFVKTVHRLTASKTHLVFGSLPYRKGEVMHSKTDVSGLVALGWRCRYDLETGLKRVIESERLRL